MSWEKKLRKIIAEEMKPRIPFAEFCKRVGIELPPDYVPLSEREAAAKKQVRPLKIISFCVLGVALLMAVVFLCVPHKARFYEIFRHDRIIENSITYEDLVAAEIPLLAGVSKDNNDSIVKVTAKDKDLVLGYAVKNILYNVDADAEQYVFSLTMTIRCYKGYLFNNYENFEEMIESGETHKMADSGTVAYIATQSGDYEYFITVSQAEESTPITEENLALLVREIL